MLLRSDDVPWGSRSVVAMSAALLFFCAVGQSLIREPGHFMNQAAFDRIGASRRWMLVPVGIFIVGAILTIGAIYLADRIDRDISQNQKKFSNLLESTMARPELRQAIENDAEARATLLQQPGVRQQVMDDPELRRIFFPEENGAESAGPESVPTETDTDRPIDESPAETDE